ncbi:gas vesicle protein [Paenibacillus sp. BSR1-1]|uniref:gas vesicle protein n=1 Tax=Paenibacillus sp. BSR1-1 TaxID=3020845 RepID=UPI0025AF8B15|nr:gas vesicle protein [Paenibacillus sp. BSR1-1]MDN3015356.1 gas vesicle protein [Paenibacillus sp. BSR1-1]
MERYHLFENKEMTLLDLLDGIIDTGVVVRGEILISIANIDLIVVDLKLLISSIESAFGQRELNNGGEVILNGTDALRLEQGRARIGEISTHDH